jgi:hypothetical protein
MENKIRFCGKTIIYPYSGELKIGQEVFSIDGGNVRFKGKILEMIDDRTLIMTYGDSSEWQCNRREDGVWGGDCTAGYLGIAQLKVSNWKQELEQ